MNPFPFIAGSYGVTIGLALVFAIGTAIRIGRAKRRLLALETAGSERRRA